MAHRLNLELLSDDLKTECEFLKDKTFKVSLLAGDASHRMYYLLKAEHSYVLQVNSPFTEENRFLALQKMLLQSAVAVPKVFAVVPTRGWVVMEDLGSISLQEHVQKRPESTITAYKAAIDLMLQWNLNLAYNNEDYLSSRNVEVLAFDFKKFNDEMAYTAKYLVHDYWAQSETSAKFLTALKTNSQYLASRQCCFCHRDYHARNIMHYRDNLYVIDFQDARTGPISYDIVSLLWDPYVRLCETDVKTLFSYWLKQLSEKISAEHDICLHGLAEEVERMKVQRFLKAAGSFASFKYLKQNEDYLQWIEPAVNVAIASLETLLDQYECSDARDLDCLAKFLASQLG